MNDKSIVMVASYGGPYGGNFIPSLVAYDSVVKRLGFRTVYIFPSFVMNYAWVEEMHKVADNIYFIPYDQYSLDNIERIRKICKKENAKLIYSRMSGWDIAARLAVPGLPIIWHMEIDLTINDRKTKLKSFLKYRILGGANVYHISVSESTAKTINSLGVRHKCVWIPNAINLERLEKRPVLPFGKPTRLLCFAYHPFIKGFDIALDACEILNKESVKYVLMASAQKNTYAYVAERYGDRAPEWLELLEPTNDIASVYSQADIMLSASRNEGFSYCLLEAIYSGLPFVYSDIPGTRWADEMEMGTKFSSGDAASLAEAILRCAAEPVSPEKQQRNRERTEEKYFMSAWQDKISELIRTLT